MLFNENYVYTFYNPENFDDFSRDWILLQATVEGMSESARNHTDMSVWEHLTTQHGLREACEDSDMQFASITLTLQLKCNKKKQTCHD